MNRHLLAVASSVFFVAAVSTRAESPAPDSTAPAPENLASAMRPAVPAWTIDDLVLAESAGGFAVSPDGTRAVWVKTTIEKIDGTEKRVSNLVLSRLADGTTLQLTRGHDTISAPSFAPDGAHVAFLSTRHAPGTKADDDAKTQIWAIPLAGGEAFPVSRLERNARTFGFIDAATVLVAAQESPSQWERERKQAKDDAIVVDDIAHEPPVRLFRIPLTGGPARRLATNTDFIDAIAISPDGRRAVITAQQSVSYDFDERIAPQTYIVDTTTGVRTRLFANGVLRPENLRFSPDGTALYFVNRMSRHPRYRQATVAELWCHNLTTGTTERIGRDWPRGLGGGFCPLGDGVLALLADGVHLRPVRFVRTTDGWSRSELTGVHTGNILGFEAGRDGSRVVYQYSTATVPTQWFGARLDGAALVDPQNITRLNPGFAGKPTGRVEVVRFAGANGDEVEGILHYPLDWKQGERRPLILSIHGGPAGADLDKWGQRWAAPLLLWRQRGAFVLQVNYHGSSNYGLDWVESIAGHYYELEVPDLEAGVDEMIRRGLADPARLATTGWSNGGILSVALITTTTRYRAASIGAADVEWFSDWANVDFGAAFDNYYFGGAPWEVPDIYRAKSPFFKLPGVTTPTVVFTGTADRNVPPHQSWSLFRALQQIGRAPVTLVLFPDEPHSLRQPIHQRRKLAEELAFFDRHLFAVTAPHNEAVKDGSLLAGLLGRSRAARVGAAFGIESGGILIPETVAVPGEAAGRVPAIEIGRFEVTAAQFRAFDTAFVIAPGGANMPAVISFERARAYASWLAKRTGRAFRLPTTAEADAFAGLAGSGGNTLDRWAGYPPNLDDAERLTAALAPLGPAPLLLPVGSLPGRGDDPVFDLDGNAAEWAVKADNTGTASGASADQVVEPAGPRAPAAAYTGLRMVVAVPPTP